MCEPTTILMGVGLAMSAYGAHQQAEGQKELANYNAQVASNNATLAEYEALDATRRGDEAAAAVRRNADMLKGSQRSSMAARGLDLAEGTAAELQDQTEFFALTDMATARHNAAREAWSIRAQGSAYSGEAAKQRAIGSAISPTAAAGSTLLTGAGAVANKWYSRPQAAPSQSWGNLDPQYFGGTGGMGG